MPENPPPDPKDSLQNRQQAVPSEHEPEVINGLPVDVFEKLPPDIRRAIISYTRYVGPAPNPLFNKIDGEHIHKLIDSTENDEKRAFQDAQSSKWFHLVYVLLAIGVLVFLTLYLPGVDRELYKDVLRFLGTFLSGLGTGFGAAYLLSKRKKET